MHGDCRAPWVIFVQWKHTTEFQSHGVLGTPPTTIHDHGMQSFAVFEQTFTRNISQTLHGTGIVTYIGVVPDIYIYISITYLDLTLDVRRPEIHVYCTEGVGLSTSQETRAHNLELHRVILLSLCLSLGILGILGPSWHRPCLSVSVLTVPEVRYLDP